MFRSLTCFQGKRFLLVEIMTGLLIVFGGVLIQENVVGLFLDWDLDGIRSAVRIDGKINDNSFVDKGWTAEIAFPVAKYEMACKWALVTSKNGRYMENVFLGGLKKWFQVVLK